jgi:HEPN domain-containing protein
MMQEETVAHWRKCARDALESAAILHEAGKYGLALLACHLAIEHALKAVFVKEHDREPPPTHNLAMLAVQLASLHFTTAERVVFEELTGNAEAAWDDDPGWADTQATEGKVKEWLSRTNQLLNRILRRP